jgi:hypothetical protein
MIAHFAPKPASKQVLLRQKGMTIAMIRRRHSRVRGNDGDISAPFLPDIVITRFVRRTRSNAGA